MTSKPRTAHHSLSLCYRARQIANHEFSRRTWKAKLKEWRFESYVTDNEKSVAIANTEKRKRDREENDHAAFSGVRQVSPTRLAH